LVGKSAPSFSAGAGGQERHGLHATGRGPSAAGDEFVDEGE